VPEMSQLLRFELRKLFRARILYICAGIIVLLILIFAGTDKLIDLSIQEMSDFINTPSEAIEDYTEVPDDQIEFEEEMSEGMINSMGINPNSRTGLARLLGALNNIYVIMVIGVFAAVYICGDFGNTVIKNIISKGYTRTQVYFAKYLITLIVSLAYALLAMLMGFLCGVIMWNAGSGWSARVLLLILLQLLAIAAYSSLFTFLAALLKRVGSVLAVCIAVPIGFTLILSLVDLFLMDTGIEISKFWLGGFFATLSTTGAEAGEIVIALLGSLAYLAVFTVCGWLLARKREV